MAGIIPDVLADVVKNANDLSASAEAVSSDAKLEELLFPFFEALGYSSTRVGDIVIAPIYDKSAQEHIDYGLVGFDSDTFKTVITVIPDAAAENYQNGLARSQRCLDAVSVGDKMMPGYLLITDCFSYTLFDVDARTKALRQVSVFDLRSLNPSAFDAMKLICNPQSEATQWFVVRTPEVTQEPASEPKETQQQEPQEPPKPVKSKPLTLTSVAVKLICVGIVFAALVATVILCVSFSGWSIGWFEISPRHTTVELNLTTLTGKTYASLQNDGRLLYSLTDTNLPAQSEIAVVCKTNNDSKTFNLRVGEDGTIAAYLSLPSGWTSGTMSVSSELVFGSDQCDAANAAFGITGENIINAKLGHVGYVISTASVSLTKTNNSTDTGESSTTQSGGDTNGKYNDVLKNCSVVLYSNGDVCIYPKGYSTDDWESNNDNINITDKSYCKILWSEAEQKATLYYVCGTIMDTASWNRGVIILSDGANTYNFKTSYGVWKLHINGFYSVTGWCRFDESGVANMILILKAIYSSERSTIEFKDLNEKLYISSNDRKAVLNQISIYEEYFDGHEGKPDMVAYIQAHR